MTSVFGDIFVTSVLEEAVIDLLQTWYPTYLREVERQLNEPVGVLTSPVSYTNRNTFDSIPGDRMPLCVVISPGLIDEPITYEKGKYTAVWQLGVGVAIAAKDEPTANRLVKMYAAATRALILQHQSISGLANRVDWLDESESDLPINDQIQLYKACGVYFSVEIENAVDKFTGPTVPDEPVYPPIGTVGEVIVDVGRL